MSGAGERQFWRLFVAVGLPEPVKAEILKAQAQLKRAAGEARISWTRSEQFHLTLKFLGSVETERVTALEQALKAAAGAFSPLRLRAEKVGFFPGSRSPRVIWVGVQEGREQLGPLHQAVETAVSGFTAEAPEGRFSGHVTLGRVKSIRRAETEALGRAAAALEQTCFGEWTAPAIELIRSELSPKGARYTTVAEIPLGRSTDC